MNTIQIKSSEVKAWNMLVECLSKYLESSCQKTQMEAVLGAAEQFKSAHMERISKDMPSRKK